MLKLTNTLTGNKEPFVPLEENTVKMYVCGITPYDYSHLGHGRVYVTFDVLYRFLHLLGYTVTYCRNFTDIDDKLINKAAKELNDPLKYKQVADTYIAAYQEDMKKLNNKNPDYEPCVTDHIPEIIEFIESLIAQEYAYRVNGDVYFHIDRFPEYGKLSKRSTQDLFAGARVEINEQKLNPLDFALWKSEDENTFWNSPWGWGRPGWHIECSALAGKYLGQELDIHGGGMDLIFPHHENEVAQSECRYHKQFVRTWMHNGFVNVNKEKMSKSLGNFFTLRDIFELFDPQIVRFYYLNHLYRAPLEFSLDDLHVAKKSYQRLCTAFMHVESRPMTYSQMKDNPILARMLDFLSDDLNTVGMFGVVYEELPGLATNKDLAQGMKYILTEVLGLTLQPIQEKKISITSEMQALIDQREAARSAKDWAKADELRDQLKQLGFEVQDKKK